MNKSRRIADFLKDLPIPEGVDPHYGGYFHCFNQGLYYEAHDLLEQLWLASNGADFLFYKGLIQVAGAFVHLQKQFTFPKHHKYGQRLRPAARLLKRAASHLAAFGPCRHGLQIEPVLALCLGWASVIEESGFHFNPWHPDAKPQLSFGPAMA